MRQLLKILQSEYGVDPIRDKKLHGDVRALHELFTERRAALRPNYFANPNQLRAYLGYYLPLNFDKVSRLLAANQVFEKRPLSRWLDFGCGPATASLAALSLLAKKMGEGSKFALPKLPIKIDLIDPQHQATDMGRKLLEAYAAEVGIPIEVRVAKSLEELKEKNRNSEPYDLALAVNVLNEMEAEENSPMIPLFEQTDGFLLVVEPSHRVASQKLLRNRGKILQAGGENIRLVGPCLHQEKCPLVRTQHWCHFSVASTANELLEINDRVFKKTREWLKFSYLLFERAPKEAAKPANIYRAIGDIHPSGPETMAIDLCVPSEKKIFKMAEKAAMALPEKTRAALMRGALVEIDETKNTIVSVKPLA